MKIAQIVHNPTAGNAEHTKKDLLKLVKDAGFKTYYISTDDENWKEDLRTDVDVFFLAGGDGTVHKLATALLKKDLLETKIPPIRLVPLGTANNISKTLDINPDRNLEINIEGEVIQYDCGRVKGLPEEDLFFESIGLGIFPELIQEMKKKDLENTDREKKLELTLRVLLKIVKNFKAQPVTIDLDDISITGCFLMVELMNIKYVGPNLELAPHAHPGDGHFDLVLIAEANRRKFISYLEKMIDKKDHQGDIREFSRSLKVKNVKMHWQEASIHVDDDFIDDKAGKSFSAEIEPGALNFFEQH